MDFSNLGISVDSTSAKQAATDLDSLASSAAGAEAAVGKLADADGKAATAATSASQQVQAQSAAVSEMAQQYQKAAEQASNFNTQASRPIQQAATPLPSVFTSNRSPAAQDTTHVTQAATATQQLANAEKQLSSNTQAAVNAEQAIQRSYEQTVVSLNNYLQSLGKTRAEKILIDAEDKFGQGARLEGIKGIVAEIQAREQQVASLKRAGQAIEGTTKLTAGQTREIAVLGHEIVTGNFSRIPGSLIVMGERMGNLGAIASAVFSGIGLSILGTVAALGVYVTAVIEAENQTQEFQRAIELSGNAIGTTADQLNDMANAMSHIGASRGDIVDTLAQMAQMGKIAKTSLQDFATTAIESQRNLGLETKETLKILAEIAKDPVKAAQQYNDAMHFLTASQYEQIVALQARGETEKAAAIEQQALMNALNDRVDDVKTHLSDLDSFTRTLGDDFRKMWSGIVQTISPETIGAKVDAIKARLAGLAGTNLAFGGGVDKTVLSGPERQAAQIELADNERIRRQRNERAEAQAYNASLVDGYAKAQETLSKFQTKEERWLALRAKILKSFEGDAAVGKPDSPEKQAQVLADARQSIFGKGKSTVGDENAALREQVDAIKRAYEEQNNIYVNSEKILDQTHQAGMISDKEYYEAKREFVQLETQAQIKALQDENARLAASASNTRARIEQDRQINANETKIRELRVDGATKIALITGQEEANNKKLAESYLRLDDSVKKYVQTLQDQHQKSLQSLGLGSTQKAEQDAELQIIDRIQQARQQLEDSRRKMTAQEKADNQAAYDAEKKSLDDYQSKALADTHNYYDQLKEYNADWRNGVIEAFNDMHDKTQNIAATAKSSIENMMNSVTNAFENFIETGKLDWKGLADSIVKDILRVIIQIQELQAMEALGISGGAGGISANGLGGILGDFASNFDLFGVGGTAGAGVSFDASTLSSFGSFSGFLANGGSAESGGIYRVNEQGPELLTVGGNTYLMMGNQSGMVTPNSQLGGTTHNQVINFINNGPVDRRTQMQLGAEVFKQSRYAYARNG